MYLLGRGWLWLGLGTCLLTLGCKREELAAPADSGVAAPGSAAAGTGPTLTAAPPREPAWTTATVDKPRRELRPVLLRAVRTARQEGFDRVVFEFEGPELPGYHLEYVSRPVAYCGSGEPAQVAGAAQLEVRLVPARAHEDGQSTLAERERAPALPVLRELEVTCDFEADVTWALGVSAVRPYRVLELQNPTRLVVDLQH